MASSTDHGFRVVSSSPTTNRKYTFTISPPLNEKNSPSCITRKWNRWNFDRNIDTSARVSGRLLPCRRCGDWALKTVVVRECTDFRLNLGRQFDDVLQVSGQMDHDLLIPQQIDGVADRPCFFSWSGVRIPLGTEKNSFTYFPYLCRTWKILSSEYSGNETAWILTGVLTRSPVYPAYLIPRRFQGVLDYTHSVVNNHGTYADLNANPNPIPNPYKSTAH